MTTRNEPYVSGFNIEIPETNFQLHVVDVYGNHMSGASVNISFDGAAIDGICDANGCFQALVKTGTVCNLLVTKQFYSDFNTRIVLLPVADFTDPAKNLMLKVVDGDNSDLPLANATVAIHSDAHDDNGTTNGEGMFEGRLETDYINTVQVSLTGYQDYNSSIQPYVAFSCGDSQYRVVQVITLTS